MVTVTCLHSWDMLILLQQFWILDVVTGSVVNITKYILKAEVKNEHSLNRLILIKYHRYLKKKLQNEQQKNRTYKFK